MQDLFKMTCSKYVRGYKMHPYRGLEDGWNEEMRSSNNSVELSDIEKFRWEKR